MKKVLIIGAGIAGLTCGIYTKMNGFDVQIYEMHNVPGGECTGWDRGDYHFDGCIHWLVGSRPDTDLHKLWKTTGALHEDTQIINHEAFGVYEEDGRSVSVYTHADKLQKHLLEISPQDAKEIRRLCNAIKALGSFGMPIEKPMDMMTVGDGIKFAARNLGSLGKLSRYRKMSMAQFASRFKNPLLQKAFLSAIPGDYTSTALVFTLAGMHRGDSGYPIGGSRAFAKRMEQRFIELGGEIYYKHRAEKVIIMDGRAVGLRMADGKEVFGNFVISCADGYATLYRILENKHTPDVYKKLFADPKKYQLPTSAIVFMGIGCEIETPHRSITIKRESSVNVSGVDTDTAMLLSYAYDNTMAPRGKTVMAGFYEADYDYWSALYKDKEQYKQAKERLRQDAIAVLLRRFPQAEGKIETTDVVTPLTYERYCNAWRGAWMSWGSGSKDIPQYHPGELPGLENFIMAGMWTLPPGGLPGAAAAGRFAAHRLCIREGVAFRKE